MNGIQTIDGQDWDRIEELFSAAADLPEADQELFLGAACRGDEELFLSVRQLLRAERHGPDLMAAVESEALSLLDTEPLTGLRLGAYRLIREIGRGGMGAVYLAERDDDEFSKEVAVKVVGGSLSARQWVSRFRQERQILARLEHPYLARMLDAGTTANGLLYLVMEYVPGLPITQYCQEHALSVRQRLMLFCKVCEAVQYAHQHLVVHRDLKPGNILVEEAGTPRLLDFGIAKLLDDTGGAAVTSAETWQPLTPQYASPEQIRGEPINTASDIYSLGAVLFEMLADRLPFPDSFSSPLEALQIISNTEIAAPSSLAGKHRPDIDADIDSIVLKAMCKEPQLRYASAEHLRDDVRRYLENQPVLAQPPSLFYTGRKFIRRYKTPLLIASLVTATMTIGLSALLLESHRAQRRSGEIHRLSNTLLFDIQNRIQLLPGSTAVQESLVKTSVEYLDRLVRDTRKDPALSLDLAEAYQKIGDVQGYPLRPSLGHSDDSIESYRKGLNIVRELQPTYRVRYIHALLLERIGYVSASRDSAEALRNLTAGLQIAEDLYKSSPEDPETIDVLVSLHNHIGTTETIRGNRAAVEANFRRTLEISQRWADQAPSELSRATLARSHIRMGRALHLNGDLLAALNQARTAAKMLEQFPGVPSPASPYSRDLLNAYEQMARITGYPGMPNLGDRPQAAAYEQRVISIAKQLARADPDNFTAWSDLSIADRDYCSILQDMNPKAARTYCDEAHQLVAKWIGKSHPYFAATLTVTASLEAKEGHRAKALELLDESERTLQKAIKADGARVDLRIFELNALELRGIVQESAGELYSALRSYERALHAAESLVSSQPSNLLLRNTIGDCYEKLGGLYLKLAKKTSGSAGLDHAKQAEQCYEKALITWNNWRAWGVSSKYDVKRGKDASQMLETSRAKLRAYAVRARTLPDHL